MTSTKNSDRIERTESGSQRQTDFAPLRISHILAPTDLSRESRKAVNYALWLARRFHAKLTVLHFYETPGTFECAFGVPDPDHLQREKDRAETAFARPVRCGPRSVREHGASLPLGRTAKRNPGRREDARSRSDRYFNPQQSMVAPHRRGQRRREHCPQSPLPGPDRTRKLIKCRS